MKNLLASVGQMLFPNLCVCCDGYLSKQEVSVCDLCLYTLSKFELIAALDNPLAKKFWGRLKLEAATAYLSYKGTNDVKKLMHALKYKGDTHLGIEMGKWLGDALIRTGNFSTIDCVIPIPLHPKRQMLRGYNQCDLLGHGLCEAMKIPMISDVVVRERHNSTQTKKKRYDRYVNSKELFKVIDPSRIQGKNVLLIDDVITTGSTMESCGSVLLDVEGLRLSLASLAVAI
ncbi:MAG: phosphoribosyltransferase family protein [Bacteroidia bacterium]|jgi:ComF family protein|nr:phosphoribosyltransferase family protein [Bacteroidia bacterium]